MGEEKHCFVEDDAMVRDNQNKYDSVKIMIEGLQNQINQLNKRVDVLQRKIGEKKAQEKK